MIAIEGFYYLTKYLTMSNSEKESYSIDEVINNYLKQRKRENTILCKLKNFFDDFFNQYRSIKIKNITPYIVGLIISFSLYLVLNSNPDSVSQIIVAYSLLTLLVSIMFILFSAISDIQKAVSNRLIETKNDIIGLTNELTQYSLLHLKLKEKDINKEIIDLDKIENETIVMIPIVILLMMSFVSYILGIPIQFIIEQANQISGIPIIIIATAIFSLIIKSQSELVAYKKVLIAIQKAQIMKENNKNS